MKRGVDVADLETYRSIAQCVLSNELYCPDPRSSFSVVLYGGFVREARRAYLRCRQAVRQFLVLCPKRLSRDMCKMICVPLLRTWFDDCTWFEGDHVCDLDVKLVYSSRSRKVDEFKYYTRYLKNVIMYHLASSTFKECFHKGSTATKRYHGHLHDLLELRRHDEYGDCLPIDLVREVSKCQLDMTVNGWEMRSNGQGGVRFVVHEDVKQGRVTTLCGQAVDAAMIDSHLVSKSFLCTKRRVNERARNMVARGWKLATLVPPPKPREWMGVVRNGKHK